MEVFMADKKDIDLKPIRKVRLYEEVEAQLMKLVTDGVLQPGDKFPSESVLIKQLNVSRAVLREAFRILEQKGLAYSIQGGGRYLRSIEKANNLSNEYLTLELEKTSIIEIYEARLGLEPIAAKLAAIRWKPKDIEEMESIIYQLEKVDQHSAYDYPFHIAIAKASGNYVMGEMISMQINLVYGVTNEKVNNILNQRQLKDFVKEHRQILDAIKKRDGILSARLMEEHLKKSYDALTNYANDF
jgi:GntR family transcriptional repressor for pyruvate dehydrogenase complex